MTNYPLTFGKKDQLEFANEAELYYVIGYLTKANNFELKHEDNDEQKAWGKEKRIHVLNTPNNYPKPLENAHRKGNGSSVLYRINCNPFVERLLELGFSLNQKTQDVAAIRANIPKEFLTDFDNGCNA
jgi:hypothetical protein